jgi:hypothetical protein
VYSSDHTQWRSLRWWDWFMLMFMVVWYGSANLLENRTYLILIP